MILNLIGLSSKWGILVVTLLSQIEVGNIPSTYNLIRAFKGRNLILNIILIKIHLGIQIINNKTTINIWHSSIIINFQPNSHLANQRACGKATWWWQIRGMSKQTENGTGPQQINRYRTYLRITFINQNNW